MDPASLAFKGSQAFRFGAVGDTAIHPVIACGMLLVAILIFLPQRKYALAPLLSAAFLVPMDQVLIVGPFHFMMLRVLILLAWIKILQAGYPRGGGLIAGGVNGIDKALVLYVVSSGVTFTLLWSQWG